MSMRWRGMPNEVNVTRYPYSSDSMVSRRRESFTKVGGPDSNGREDDKEKEEDKQNKK